MYVAEEAHFDHFQDFLEEHSMERRANVLLKGMRNSISIAVKTLSYPHGWKDQVLQGVHWIN